MTLDLHNEPQILANVEVLGPLIEVAAVLDGLPKPEFDRDAIRNSLREGARELRSMTWKRTHMVNRTAEVKQLRAGLELLLGRAYQDPVWARGKIERELRVGMPAGRIAERLLLSPERYGQPTRVRLPPNPAELTAAIAKLDKGLRKARQTAEMRYPLIVREIGAAATPAGQ